MKNNTSSPPRSDSSDCGDQSLSLSLPATNEQSQSMSASNQKPRETAGIIEHPNQSLSSSAEVHQIVVVEAQQLVEDEFKKAEKNKVSSLPSSCSSVEQSRSTHLLTDSSKLVGVQQIIRAQQLRLESQRSNDCLEEPNKEEQHQHSASRQQCQPSSGSRSSSSQNSRGSESCSSKFTSNSVSSRSQKNPSYDSSFHENPATSQIIPNIKQIKMASDPQSEISKIISKEEIKESINSLRSSATLKHPSHGIRQQAVAIRVAVHPDEPLKLNNELTSISHQQHKIQQQPSQIPSTAFKSRHSVMLRRSNTINRAEIDEFQVLSEQLNQLTTAAEEEPEESQIKQVVNEIPILPQSEEKEKQEVSIINTQPPTKKVKEQEDDDAVEKYNDMQIQKQVSLLDDDEDDDYFFEQRAFKLPECPLSNQPLNSQQSRTFLFQPIPSTSGMINPQQTSQPFPSFAQQNGKAPLLPFTAFAPPQRPQSVPEQQEQLQQGYPFIQYEFQNQFTPPQTFVQAPLAISSQQNYPMFPSISSQQQQKGQQQNYLASSQGNAQVGAQLQPQTSSTSVPFFSSQNNQNPSGFQGTNTSSSMKRNPQLLLEIQSVFSSQSSSTQHLPKYIPQKNAGTLNNNNSSNLNINNCGQSQASTAESERINTQRSGSSSGNFLDNQLQEDIIKQIQLKQSVNLPLQPQQQQQQQPQMIYDSLSQHHQQYLQNPLMERPAFYPQQHNFTHPFQPQPQRFATSELPQAQQYPLPFQTASPFLQEANQNLNSAFKSNDQNNIRYQMNNQLPQQMMFNPIEQQQFMPQYNEIQFQQMVPRQHSRMGSCMEFRQIAQQTQQQIPPLYNSNSFNAAEMQFQHQQQQHQQQQQQQQMLYSQSQQVDLDQSSMMYQSKGKKKLEIKEETKKYDIDLNNLEADGRTTVYIQNIPNKYTLNCVLETIQKNHSDNFDFFYLPIDFQVTQIKNKCNVGYAFINFIKPENIRDFFIEFNGKKWKKFNSDKICNLKYARIQGRIHLEDHFQNSSVMNQREKKFKPVFLSISDLIQSQKLQQSNGNGNTNVNGNEPQKSTQSSHGHSSGNRQHHQIYQRTNNKSNLGQRHSTHYVQKN